MTIRRNVRPEDDPRVVRLKADRQALLDCMHRIARGGTFNYCFLDRIDNVIASKERKKEEAQSKLHRLCRERQSIVKRSSETCEKHSRPEKFCDCDPCVEDSMRLDYLKFEIKVHAIRMQILRSIIVRLNYVRKKGPELRPAYWTLLNSKLF